MSLEKQHLILSNFISNTDVAALTLGIVKPEYFDTRYRPVAKFILDYTAQYKSVPSETVIKAETGVTLEKRAITRGEVDYTTTEIEKFCRQGAVEKVVLYGANMLGTEKTDAKYGELVDMMKDAVSVSLHKDLGIKYFADPHTRMQQLAEQTTPISTGWVELDDIIGGGLVRKEMTLFGAASGRGKSIVMANLCVNLMQQGLNVLYITLELSDLIVSKRFDTMISKIPYVEILNRANEVADNILVQGTKMGQLDIKRMKESVTTANDIRAYMKEFELVYGYIPDVIAVDYIDLMASNRAISVDNIFTKDKYVTEELRSIADDLNCMMISAVQLGKGSEKLEEKDISQGNIQGGSSKVNTTDNFVGIIQSEAQMAAGEYVLKGLKTRSAGGVGRTATMKWKAAVLRIMSQGQDNFRRDTFKGGKGSSPFTMPEGVSVNNNNANSVLGLLDNMNKPKL